MDRIDFRSDTVSWPTAEMRQAMAAAPVGDDVYGEDPTVNQLEARAAEKLGKAAGLFVASGTMGNLVAILSHASRGEEAILGYDSHVFQWEAGGIASVAGVMPHVLPTDEDGRMEFARVEQAVRDRGDSHHARTKLLLVENSFGGRGGYPLPLDYFARLREIADRHGLRMHMDGARVFNAAVALGVDVRQVVGDVDSVTFCLSKGLSAPAGSVLCGSEAFIGEARRARKMLGGGMRQAGVLAAAGLLAIDRMVDGLAEDHRRARILADGLAGIPGIVIDPERTRTNIVHFRLDPATGLEPVAFARRIGEEHGIGLGTYPVEILRAVTHAWIGDDDVQKLLDACRGVLG